MDPKAFIRLSIGSLQLRVSSGELTAVKSGYHRLTSPCSCEIRLRGFPHQTTSVPLVSSPQSIPGSQNIASSFYLEESDLKALLTVTPRCFFASHSCLEIIVFAGQKGSNCGKRQQIGTFKLEVGPEWGKGKPVILFNGWIGIGKSKQGSGNPGAELHLCVKLDPDPRYVFQFADETKLSPQIVQLQGTIRQPIFSCKFSQDRVSHLDSLNNFWSFPADDQESERRERKGWKVKIHDLSGSAIAAAFITTPFVPSSGCDWVARSNPGSWLIVRPDYCRPDSWQPWGKLEAWRERGVRDLICFRFHLLPEVHDGGGGEILMSEIFLNAEKGGEFSIDVDRHVQATGAVTPVSSPQRNGDMMVLSPVVGGFVMSCKVQGEGKISKPSVQLAKRHISCAEDAAIFMALAAAVDLSIEACRPFQRKPSRRTRHSW